MPENGMGHPIITILGTPLPPSEVRIKHLIYSVVIAVTASCGTMKKSDRSDGCTLEMAIEMAKARLEMKRLNVESFNVRYAKQSKAYLVVFNPIELSDPREVEVIISRDSCAIISESYR